MNCPTITALEGGYPGLYLHDRERNGELRKSLPGDDSYLEVSTEGIGIAHRFQLVKNGLQAGSEVLQTVGVILVHEIPHNLIVTVSISFAQSWR